MAETYTFFDDLAGLIGDIHPDSIISRTFYRDDRMKGVLFGFDAGQELSEHTSSQKVVVQVVQGEALITLGDDRHEVTPGAWLHIPAHLKHSIHARTPLILLLLMLGKE